MFYEPPPDYPMVEDRWPNNKSIEYYTPRNHYYHQQQVHLSSQYQNSATMLRTRHVPEIAGIYQSEEQPSLRRFTRYNQSIKMMPSQIPEVMQSPKSMFTKNSSSTSKKPLFSMGNWTFRDKNKKSARQNISESHVFNNNSSRPQSMNLSNLPDIFRRSKSGDAISQNRTSIIIGDFPRGETRVPIKVERSPRNDFRTNITVEDTSTSSSSSTKTHENLPILRPKKDEQNNNYSFQSCAQLRKSCPDLENAQNVFNSSRISTKKRKTRRSHEKAQLAAWKRKYLKDWTLDDVLLWLQSHKMDEIASLLIGYDLSGKDLLEWNDNTLIQLGVGDDEMRQKLLEELEKIKKNGPEKEGRTLFDLVKQTSYDQVLAVETPLTTRDITVTHGRLGCLQITKVNGANLPLREHDCLLEINERSGEHFKSALMLTKLISDSSGSPIRFVVLRRKIDNSEFSNNSETVEKETLSSSGISSSPPTPK
ncbi:unnamed protein product [Caenorhabditis angaria]|uniref:SAM domain-containing protein n=1 Tax=Caenorhabditis angaria TaxID=860376 RepID=A0A9P1IH28_9PELO|nr:unnamed protein product [Caenorhabditis angaria]